RRGPRRGPWPRTGRRGRRRAPPRRTATTAPRPRPTPSPRGGRRQPARSPASPPGVAVDVVRVRLRPWLGGQAPVAVPDRLGGEQPPRQHRHPIRLVGGDLPGDVLAADRVDQPAAPVG